MNHGYSKEDLAKDTLLETEALRARVYELTWLNVKRLSRRKLLVKLEEIFQRDETHRVIYTLAGSMLKI